MIISRTDAPASQRLRGVMKSAGQPDGETGLTDSTWTDSTGNHKASDPNNWSSGTAPMPGDNLFVQGGSTLSVRDNNLQEIL